jgi:hypothetical protein
MSIGSPSDTPSRGFKALPTREEPNRRLYLLSCKMSAAEALTAIRAHWGIENKLPWVLDVVFDEDRSRARKDNVPPHRPQHRTLKPRKRLRPQQNQTRRMGKRLPCGSARPNAIALPTQDRRLTARARSVNDANPSLIQGFLAAVGCRAAGVCQYPASAGLHRATFDSPQR